MKLTRRSLFVAASATAMAGSLPEAIGAATAKDWRSVRRLFNLSPELTHLGLFLISSHPKPVRDAIEQYRKQLDLDPMTTIERGMFDFDHQENSLPTKAANAIARYLGASGNDIALTHNTTTGLALIYLGLPFAAGDEILTTAHDHFVHHEAIRYAAERTGATSRKIPLFDSYDKISADEIVSRIKKAIGPKTKVVGVTWVHSASGLKLPIRRIKEAIDEVNRTRKDRVLLVVDGVHGIGVEDPKQVIASCDAFAAGAHKWLLGPRGTGFVWAKPEVWATMRPIIPSFTAPELFVAWMDEKKADKPRAAWFSPGGFPSFEHYWATPAAIELHESLGPDRVTERIHALNTLLKEGLAKLPQVELHTPLSTDLSAGIVCFDVKGIEQVDVVKKLHEKKIIASTTPYKLSHARLSCGIYNDESDIERALKALKAVT
jgi:isopenicillin-N epimerase